MLEALVAHQVGHQRLRHGPLLWFLRWFALPWAALDRGLAVATRANLFAFKRSHRGRSYILLGIPLLGVALLRTLLLIPTAAARAGMTQLGCHADLAADRYAADLGYAQPLIAAISLLRSQPPTESDSRPARWLLSAPVQPRIERLEWHAAATAGSSALGSPASAWADDVAAPIAGELSPGALVSGFRVIREIGRGGMGIVYEALEERLDRRVALKLLSAELSGDAWFRERFEQEGVLLAQLAHPNILRLMSRVDIGDQVILVMELVVGGTLDSYVAMNALTIAEKITLLEQVAAGLDAAHRAGVIHRDIKPANVLVDTAIQRPLIGDFGLARRIGEETGLTAPGAAMGTSHYIAPEVLAHGVQVASTASDIYSFGCLAFEVFTGAPPFADLDGTPLTLAHTGAPRPLVSAHLVVPAAVDGFVLELMDVDPDARPSSASAAVERLTAELTEDPDARAAAGATIPGHRQTADRRGHAGPRAAPRDLDHRGTGELGEVAYDVLRRWHHAALSGRGAELAVGEQLASLELEGWSRWRGVFLRGDGGGGDIDHVVAGPGGVFAIEVKASPHGIESGVKQAATNAGRLERKLAGPVQAVLCVAADSLTIERRHFSERMVWLVPKSALVDTLRYAQSASASQGDIQRLEQLLSRGPNPHTRVREALADAISGGLHWWSTGPVFPDGTHLKLELVVVGSRGVIAVREMGSMPHEVHLERAREGARAVQQSLACRAPVTPLLVVADPPEPEPTKDGGVDVVGAGRAASWLRARALPDGPLADDVARLNYEMGTKRDA